ncbi:type II secretion system protein M [Aestuariibacter halophilus]|uniref:Type II secretion system protein M n=1 Tax=Fluctibacter halophilus TaxID=226011 RepID=A0ABS8G4W9_9ALTE|nr:type II secretion system protein M [Aestuariibacter halophilus]MCC2615622.1 type II secretion system protein M [Aestuariibacter halophilus]
MTVFESFKQWWQGMESKERQGLKVLAGLLIAVLVMALGVNIGATIGAL